LRSVKRSPLRKQSYNEFSGEQRLWQFFRTGSVLKGGTGVPPVNHVQDARATIKLNQYQRSLINKAVPC